MPWQADEQYDNTGIIHRHLSETSLPKSARHPLSKGKGSLGKLNADCTNTPFAHGQRCSFSPTAIAIAISRW